MPDSMPMKYSRSRQGATRPSAYDTPFRGDALHVCAIRPVCRLSAPSIGKDYAGKAFAICQQFNPGSCSNFQI